MKYVIGLVVVALVGFVFMTAETTGTSEGNQASTATIETVEAGVAEGGQLVDVRTPGEFDAGHIEGSVNIPLQSIENGAAPSVEKDKPVYVYCRSGNRSAQAAKLLKSAGFTNVIDLGGMGDVQEIGGTVVQ